MITVEDIIKWSKSHPVGGGSRRTRIMNNAIEFSIVGGGRGLYGDFKKTFEVAIFDVESGDFMTRFFYPEGSDDVIPYMDGKDLELLVNNLIKDKDFQVR
jgi:hypothetical protein